MMLYIDSVQELNTEGYFNYYDRYRIDKIKSVIDMDKLEKAVNGKIAELKGQIKQSVVSDKEELAKRLHSINPLIKVRVK